MGGPRKNPHLLRAVGANIRDVALRAEVSIATVSRVVNGVSTVAPELVQHVRDVIRDLRYVPSIQARALVSGRSHMLGLVVSAITHSFVPELIQEFEGRAVEQGYEVFIGSTNHEAVRTEALIKRMLQRRVDGVAIMTFGVEEELIRRLVARAFPMTFVDAGPDLPNSRVLKVNYGEGIWEALQHLAALGHRRIAFVSGPLQMASAVARREAFLGAMARLDFPIAPAHMVEGTHTMEGGIKAAETLLALAELPSAILCSNDMTAIGVMHGLHRASRSVPLDVSVVGFDDIHLDQFMLPPLTTVQISCKDLATAAVQALRAGIERGHPQAEQKEWPISTHLVVRQSTSSPRSGAAAQPKIRIATRIRVKQ